MPQDITPNNQSASTTNTMNPRTLSAQSAGSITPTIISQNNQDRRRRAAAREARRQENLAANVERAEIQKEYENLRRVEEAANRRAEERKAAASREKVTFYAGGVNTPLEVKRVSIGQYLGDQLKGASEPIAVSEELRQFATMGNPGESGNVDAAYLGLDKFRESVNGLLKREAEEKTLINRVREFATLTGSSVSQATYTPLTPEAREAHERLISDPNTSSEMKAQLSADLVRDSEYVKTHGINGNLSASEEKRLSEIYTGGSSVSKDLKDAAAAYLSAAGSTYGKEEFNRAQSGIYVNQTEKARDTLLQRYQARDEINNPDNTAATTAALRANQAAAGDVLNDLTESRNRLGLENVEKRELSNAVESQYSKQDARIRELLRDNPNVREDENSSRMVESILKVSDGGMVDLSSDAFFREQAATERRFGSEWASAGGKTAAEAAEDGERSTSYSRFKSAADEATEYLLIDAEGKQRYTLKQGADGGFSIFGWTGDLVASGQSAQGLPSALKNLNVLFDERSINVFRPDSDSTLVELKDETDITGIDTAATFKASVLGTLRTNEEILNADAERRAEVKKAEDAAQEIINQKQLSELDSALNDSLGFTLRIQGESVNMPKSVTEIQTPGIYINEDAKDNTIIRRSDLTVIQDAEANEWIKNAGKTVGGVADALLFNSPIKRVMDGTGVSDSLFGQDDKDAEEEPDFIVFNKDTLFSEWSDALNEFGDFLESSIDTGNKLSEGLTGRKAIETEYKNQDISWSDIISGFTDPRSASLIGDVFAKEFVGKAYLSEEAMSEIPPVELDHLTKVKRVTSKQIAETPKYAAGALTIGDSIISSAEKGGAGAALAAGAFWASQAAEGTVASAIKDPEGFVLDLEAGLLLGTVTASAAKPIFVAGSKAVKVGERVTGIINPTVRSIPSEGGKVEFTQAPRSLTAREVITMDTLTVGRVERIPIWKRENRSGLLARKPQHPDPNDRIGGQAVHVSWGSPNPFQKELEAAGVSVNIPVSTGLFIDRRFGKPLRNRILILEDVPTISQVLTDAEKKEFLDYISGTVEMPSERQLYFHNKAQDLANRLDLPVLEVSPKSYNFIGGKNKPSGMSSDAENELGIVIPNNKKGMVDPKTGELKNKILYKFANRLKFAGLEDYYNIPIYKVSFGKNAKRGSSLTFPIENIRASLKDARISKITKDHPFPKIYSEGNALTDALLMEDKAMKVSGKRPMGPLDQLAYGEHGEEHSTSVTGNIFELKKGSANPEIQGMSDNLVKAMGPWHDSFKLGDPEMFIPHAERGGFIIREGFLNKPLKEEFNLNPEEISKLGHAIERHTDIQPNILSTLKYRPTATDKILATADRLDLVRFGVTPDKKKLFIEDVINEPWSSSTASTSGQLLPPSPKKGTFDFDAFVEKSRANRKAPERVSKSPRSSQRIPEYSKTDRSYAALGGVGAAGYFGGMNAQNQRLSEMLTRGNRKERTYPEKDIDTRKYESSENGNLYRESKYDSRYDTKDSKGGYYTKGTKYPKAYDYRFDYKPPKLFDYGKGYGYRKSGTAKYSPTYEIPPYKYLKEYNSKNYINPGVYEMGHYDGKPYEAKDYSMSGYQKKVKDIYPLENNRLRRRSKDKKSQKRKLNYNVFTVENTEIPILRGEEALFGKKTTAFELPANKKTYYQFGNVLTSKKPAIFTEKKTKKRRR